LVIPNILLPVWFVANYLAANGSLDISFTDFLPKIWQPIGGQILRQKIG
jgi:hypothetical protein